MKEPRRIMPVPTLSILIGVWLLDALPCKASPDPTSGITIETQAQVLGRLIMDVTVGGIGLEWELREKS